MCDAVTYWVPGTHDYSFLRARVSLERLFSRSAVAMAAVTKDVYFIRHGESMYNKWRQEAARACCAAYATPWCSTPGCRRATQVRLRELRSAQHPWLDELELVVTSPLTRAIETCLGAFSRNHHTSRPRAPRTRAMVCLPANWLQAQHTYGKSPLCCALPRRPWIHRAMWERWQQTFVLVTAHE